MHKTPSFKSLLVSLQNSEEASDSNACPWLSYPCRSSSLLKFSSITVSIATAIPGSSCVTTAIFVTVIFGVALITFGAACREKARPSGLSSMQRKGTSQWLELHAHNNRSSCIHCTILSSSNKLTAVPLPSNPPADIPFSVAALLLVGGTVGIA